MSDYDNQQTSEKFSDPKWIKLFTDYPAYQELFEKNNELAELFEPHPEWAEAFASNPRWFEFLKVENVAEFFRHQPTGDQQVQYWNNQGWFDRIEKKLEKKDDLEWFKQFVGNENSNNLSVVDLSWTLLSSFLEKNLKENYTDRKKEVVELFKQKLVFAELFLDYPNWIDLFVNHPRVTEFFLNYPDWARLFFPFQKWISYFESESNSDLTEKLGRDGQFGKSLHKWPNWLKIFARKPELFLEKQTWFDQITKKLNTPEGPAWIDQLVNDKDWIKEFDESPEWALVYAFELETVNERRNLDKTSNNNENLVGLAFSGGGIRSASFGLGVLEALRDFGLLKKIDYLSTVSGGGYIGAWLSANCKRAAETWKDDNGIEQKGIDWLSPGESDEDKKKLKKNWDESISHLRRYSNYLSPKVGLFSADTWTMAAVWLRNTLLIQLTVILGIAALLLIPRLLFPLFEWWPEAGNIPFIDQWIEINWRWTTVALFILGVTGIAWNSRRLIKKGENERLTGFIKFLVCLIIASGVGFGFDFHPFPDDCYTIFPRDQIVAAIVAFFLVLGGFLLLPIFNKEAINHGIQIDYSQAKVQKYVVAPMMVVSFFVAAILWEHSQSDPMRRWNSFGDFFTQAWKYWPFQLTVVIVSLSLLSFCCRRGKGDLPNDSDQDNSQNEEESHEENRTTLKEGGNLQKKIMKAAKSLLILMGNFLVAFITSLPAMLVLYALLSAIMLLLHDWMVLGEEGKWRAFVWAPPLVLVVFSIAVVMLLGMLGRRSTECVREWWSRFAAWLAIYGFAWMVIVAVAVYGPLLGAILYYDGPWKELGSGWIGTTLAGLFAGKSASTDGTDGKGIASKLTEVVAKAAPFVFIAGLLIAVSMILHLIIAINSNDTFEISQSSLLGYPWQQLSRQTAHWDLLSNAESLIVFWIFAGCLIFVIVLAWRVDINEFSFNAFYRGRLARCFLGAARRQNERHPQLFTGFDEDDDLPLSELIGSNGSLHIVNCALNLGGSCDISLHTRHSANYTLTQLFCGSRYLIKDAGVEIGYSPTAEYGGKSGQPKLGQAIAVSGAAASPNMGYHTSPVTAFLMTLFNVRLGWWFPNPHIPSVNIPSPKFGLKFLVMELFGLANEHSRFLSISDGGHFENLAAYELVKRKCKVIIISDGECDPSYQFEGLGTLIRMCEVDFGAKIKIDVCSIQREGKSSWSRSRCAVGKIIYDDKSEGILIYIKASMSGHEGTAVLQYKAAHPDFPHESTGDQFYGEDQFESYRSLGLDITKRTFDPVMRKVDSKTGRYTKHLKETDFIECAEKLKAIWSPLLPGIGQFSRHTDRLMGLWSEISGSQGLKTLDEQLATSWPKPTPDGFRSEFYLCSELIQLMENVYLDLDLEETWEHADNKGWRSLFIQWAGSETFKKTWKMTDKNYGLRFRYFCERHLDLPLS